MERLTSFKVGDLVVEKSTKSLKKIADLRPKKWGGTVCFVDGEVVQMSSFRRKYELYTSEVELDNPVKSKIVDNRAKVVIESDIKYILTIAGVDIILPDDFIDFIEDLRTCDGSMARLLIDNDAFAKALVSAGLAWKNIRGSYGRTELFVRLYDCIEKETLKMYKVAASLEWTPTEDNIAKLPAPIREYIESLKANAVK